MALTVRLTITLILTLFSCCFFEHRPMIFKLASFVRFSHRCNTVLLSLSVRLMICHSHESCLIYLSTSSDLFHLLIACSLFFDCKHHQEILNVNWTFLKSLPFCDCSSHAYEQSVMAHFYYFYFTAVNMLLGVQQPEGETWVHVTRCQR